MFGPLGRSTSVSLGRRITCDFLYAGMKMPLVSIQKTMRLPELPGARQRARPRPSWSAIFTKAFGRVAAARPDLRQTFLSFPWERIHHHEAVAADVVVETRVKGELVLVTVPLKLPESMPLPEIDRFLAKCRDNPVARVRRFRNGLILARFPRFVRRMIWWWLLNTSGSGRSHFFGTFGVTSVGAWGVESLRPIGPWTCLLHYGAINEQGEVVVRLTYDHRVLDGSGPASALVEMEQVLQTEILAELKSRQEGEPPQNWPWQEEKPIPDPPLAPALS